jgi:hypothetical protein
MFNTSELKQSLIAAAAAIILTATAVGAAVGPAEAVAQPVFAAASIGASANV